MSNSEPTYNYYYDQSHPLKPFTSFAMANPGTYPPNNAVRVPPPEAGQGLWPVWDAAAGLWDTVQDHRGEKGYLNGQGHEIKDLGPYPDGWSTTPPPLTAEETKRRQKAELLARLDALDRQSARPARAIIKARFADNRSFEDVQTDNGDDIERLSDLESEAVVVRTQLAVLTNLTN